MLFAIIIVVVVVVVVVVIIVIVLCAASGGIIPLVLCPRQMTQMELGRTRGDIDCIQRLSHGTGGAGS
jgi:hypothetical protein